MKYNPGHIDLSGLPRAIDFEAQVARNREIIQALPTKEEQEIEQWLDTSALRSLL
jgi:hypothetical protein